MNAIKTRKVSRRQNTSCKQSGQVLLLQNYVILKMKQKIHVKVIPEQRLSANLYLYVTPHDVHLVRNSIKLLYGYC